jgi:mannose-6-phosphate isomerase-like protein (cupin superfamily)
MRKVLKIGLLVAAVVTLYFVGGVAINAAFPARIPEISGYFKPGDKLVSRFEGFDQTVLAVNDGWLHTRLEVAPNAAGPPEHFHEAFEEIFTVKSGTLSILVNGEKRTLNAGETISIPPMTRHKPFNETNETVIVEREDPKTLPVQFGFILSQLYGFMDEYPNGPSVPAMLMQLSVYGSDADSWIADGPPILVQKAMRVVMAPTARLLGYKNYYAEYKPKSEPPA